MYCVSIEIPTDLTTSSVLIIAVKTNWLERTNTKLIIILKAIIRFVNLLDAIIAIALLSAYKLKHMQTDTLFYEMQWIFTSPT
jgi:hypothetical protein